MRVAAVQHDVVWEDAAATRSRLEPWVAAAAGSGARLVVLSEMFATGFSLDAERIAEPEDGPTTAWMATQASRHDLWLCGSVAERPAAEARPRNQLVLCGPDGTRHRYAKVHPFTYAGEHERYDAGSARMVIEVDGLRVAPFVCYDLRFANQFWASGPDIDLFVVVANWPAARRRHWQALVVARAIENQAYVVAVNRVGSGGGLDYVGDSMVVDPMGEVIAAAARDEALLVTEVDPGHVAATRSRYPFLTDRRAVLPLGSASSSPGSAE